MNISDHELIYVTKKKVSCAKNHVDIWGRSYRNYNCERFQASQGMALEPLKSTRRQGHIIDMRHRAYRHGQINSNTAFLKFDM